MNDQPTLEWDDDQHDDLMDRLAMISAGAAVPVTDLGTHPLRFLPQNWVDFMEGTTETEPGNVAVAFTVVVCLLALVLGILAL